MSQAPLMTGNVHPAGCDCGGCGFPVVDEFNLIELYGNVDGQGGTISGKPVWTVDQVMAQLNRTSYPGTGIPGPGWSNDGFDARPASGDPMVLRFGFHTADTMFAEPYVYEQNGQLFGRKEYFGFQAFSAAQEQAARKAIGFWDDLIAPSFVETSADQADITFGNYTNQPGTQAYAFLPYNYSPPQTGLAGDVWVNGLQASNLQLGNGFYGLHTLVHEIGHGIGLQHPGGYNAAPGVSITYAANAEYYQDSRQYSVMSYFNAEFTGAGHIDWNRLSWVYGQTPLLHDIAAIQAIYGADPTTRTGDTVYGFNANAGKDVYDFTQNSLPVISIYDAGGTDTLDFSGWNSASTIDLNPGAFSSGGGSGIVPLDLLKARGLLPASYTEAQYDALRARYNAPDGLLHDNISIAYGTIIENAVGGGGNDRIVGNAVNNILSGNGGNDVIIGGAGNDQVNGGDGFDTASYANAVSGITASLAANRGLAGDAEGDRYTGIEKLEGSNHGDTLIGSNGNDALSGLGGQDELTGGNQDDTLDGGDGNDTLDGGNHDDVLSGGAGDDVLNGGNHFDQLFGGAGNDRLNGGNHNDQLNGGAGDDVLTGGNHNDIFAFTDLGGADEITDFRRGQDKIDVSDLDAVTGGGHDAFSWVGSGAFSGTAGELRSYSQSGSFFLAGDVDGDGVADFMIQTNTLIIQSDILFA